MPVRKIKFLVLFLIAATSFAFTSADTLAQTLNILPLGNSITAGNMCVNGDIYTCTPGGSAVGYRLRLYNRLTAAGYTVDYKGTEQYGSSLPDRHCAGFGGISDNNLATLMETGSSPHTGWKTSGPYMNSNHSDIVLLHIGTNDVLAGNVSSSSIDRILNAIDDYEAAYGKSVMVFLARTISVRGYDCGTYDRVVEYNNLTDALAAYRIANGDNLILVDMECGAGIDYDTDFADQVHPNQDGYDKMADAWYNAMISWLQSSGTQYQLTVASPVGSGSTVPSAGVHTYFDGTTIQLSATPASGYEFTSWSGSITSSENPASILMNGDKAVTPTFTRVSYSLTMNSPVGSGSTSPASGVHSYAVGASVELTATPASGYEFTGWTGSIMSSENPVQVTMNGDKTITPTFTRVSYDLTMASPVGSGSTNPSAGVHSYAVGASVELSATPASGYEFTGWSGSISSSANPVTITMSGNRSVTPTFTRIQYDLTMASPVGSGSTSPSSGVHSYVEGSSVELSATPASGYEFTGWSGSITSTENPVNITMNGNKTVTPTFTLLTGTSYNLTMATPVGSGSTSPSTGVHSYDEGSTVELTATPASGYEFTGWSGSISSSENPVSITMNGNKTVTPTFTLLTGTSYNLTMATPVGSGSTSPSAGVHSYDEGSTVELSATPESGYEFTGWSGSITSTENPVSITMNGNKTVTPTFTLITGKSYNLTMASPVGSGSSSPSTGVHSYAEGSTVELTATPEIGSRFSGWSGSISSTQNPVSITMNGNKWITPNFAMASYTLTMGSPQGSGSSVPSAGVYTYDAGIIVELTASPAEGYVFSGWSGSINSSENPVSITMNGNKEVSPTFTRIQYELTLEGDETPGIQLNPSDPVMVNQGDATAIEVSFMPPGNEFISWRIMRGSSVIIEDSAALSTTVILDSGDATLRAEFRKIIEVLDLTIPDKSSKAGDTIIASISVIDDQDVPLELVSGNLGTYPLSGLKRIDSELYEANIIIEAGGNDFPAGESIPLSNLVLSDGELYSEAFNHMIIQANDAIDANAPLIDSLVVNDLLYGKGDTLELKIYADGEAYSADPMTAINGVSMKTPRVYLEDLSGGQYLLSYVIDSVDDSVESGALEASVILIDNAGNSSEDCNDIEENTLKILFAPASTMMQHWSDLSIFPNPTRDYLFFNAGGDDLFVKQIALVDMSGRCLILEEPERKIQNFSIDVSQLEGGMYMVRIYGESGKMISKKVILTD